MNEFDLLKDSFANISTEIHKEVDLSFDIVNRVHEILRSQGRTQKDLAQILGKKESEVSKWLRGTHNFTIRTLSKLSVALGEDIIRVAKQNENWGTIYMSLPFESTIPIGKNNSYGKMTCHMPDKEKQIIFITNNGLRS